MGRRGRLFCFLFLNVYIRELDLGNHLRVVYSKMQLGICLKSTNARVKGFWHFYGECICYIDKREISWLVQ